MKLRRSGEQRRSNPQVAAHKGAGTRSGQRPAVRFVRNGCRAHLRFHYRFAAPALVGALLLSCAAGSLSDAAAQTGSPGRAGETNAALSSLERLRLTLALARTYRLTDQPQKALDMLTPLSAGPWPSAALEAEYHDELARDQDALGQPAEARRELERAVALEPTAERRFRLGQLAEHLGDREEAQRQLEAAVAAEPANIEYKTALAYILRNNGDLAGAAELMSGVLAAQPDRYALHQDLGYTYLGLGENEKAIDQFKWSLDNQQLYPSETKEERDARFSPWQMVRRSRKSPLHASAAFVPRSPPHGHPLHP
jgi:predicted Zn-dependent protease